MSQHRLAHVLEKYTKQKYRLLYVGLMHMYILTSKKIISQLDFAI